MFKLDYSKPLAQFQCYYFMWPIFIITEIINYLFLVNANTNKLHKICRNGEMVSFRYTYLIWGVWMLVISLIEITQKEEGKL